MAEHAVSIKFSADIDMSRVDAAVARLKADAASVPVGGGAAAVGGGGAPFAGGSAFIPGATGPINFAQLGVGGPGVAAAQTIQTAVAQAVQVAANQAAQGIQTAVQTGAAGGGAGGIGGGTTFGGFFGRGFGRLIGLGYLVREGMTAALATGEYNRAASLAEGDPSAQYQAMSAYREKLLGFPFVGQAVRLAEDPFGEQQAGIDLTLRSAQITDERTGLLRQDARSRRTLELQSFIEQGGGFESRRRGILSTFENQNRDIQDRRLAELANARAANNNAIAQIKQDFPEEPDQDEGQLGVGPGGAAGAFQGQEASRQINEARRSQRADRLQQQAAAFRQQIEQIDKSFGPDREAARQLRDQTINRLNNLEGGRLFIAAKAAQLRGAGRDEEADQYEQIATGQLELDAEGNPARRDEIRMRNIAENIGTQQRIDRSHRAIDLGVTSMRRLAAGDPYGADLATIESKRAANEGKYGNEEVARAQRAIADLHEEGRQIGITGRIEQLQHEIAHDPVGAQVAVLAARFQQATLGMNLFNGSGFGANPLFARQFDLFSAEARAIADQRQTQIEYITIGQGGRRRQLERLLDRDRVGAEAAGIETHGEQEAFRLREQGFGDRANESLRNSILELQVTSRAYRDSFRGEALNLRAFDISNPRDTENPTKVLTEIKDEISKLQNLIQN